MPRPSQLASLLSSYLTLNIDKLFLKTNHNENTYCKGRNTKARPTQKSKELQIRQSQISCSCQRLSSENITGEIEFYERRNRINLKIAIKFKSNILSELPSVMNSISIRGLIVRSNNLSLLDCHFHQLNANSNLLYGNRLPNIQSLQLKLDL